MQLSSERVQTTPVANRFATYEVSWSGIKNPAGESRFAKITNAAVEIVKNLGKHVYNAVVWPLNKIYNIFHPKSAAVVPQETAAAAADHQAAVVYEQEHVTVYAEPAALAEATLPQPDVLVPVEDLPELQVASSRKMTVLKTAAYGTAAVVGSLAFMVAVNRLFPTIAPSLFGRVDDAMASFFKAVPQPTA